MKLEDVARSAHVSTATVSRVLNNAGPVKSATRARVLRAVKSLNYHPNLHARTLAGGKNNALGVIVSNLENPFFLDIYKALATDAHQRGFELLLASTDYDPKRLVSNVQLMMGRRVAGLAVIVSEMEPSLLKDLTALDVPIVIYDVGVPARNISNIRVNYPASVQKTVEHLYALGHRRMAFIGHNTGLEPLLDRKKSFLETMERYSGEVQHTAVGDRDDGPQGGRMATRQLLKSGFKPTAILAVNDFMALGVLKGLREAGLRVPQDISVTGYDNITLSEFSDPPLTTVNIPRAEIGHLAFEALVERDGAARPPGRELRINPELVIRKSTGRAPSA
jgi:LacI family transcriptional regulator, galactose operon repressor